MKIGRKITSCFVLMALLLFSVFPASADSISASPLADIDLSYWYSSASSIYFRDSSIAVYYSTNASSSTLSTANMQSYANTAKSSWSSLGISVSRTYTYSSADIVMQGVSSTYAINTLGLSMYTKGYTSIPSSSLTYSGAGYYGTSTKSIYKITGPVTIYLVDTTSMNGSTYCQRVAVHEFTHALGYYGHYSNGSLMVADADSISSTTPSTNERLHLSQVY